MNISTGTTTADTNTQPKAGEVQTSTNADKISSSKTEEKKEEKTQDSKNDFKKVLEEQKTTDQITIEQPQQNNMNLDMVNEQYADKFGFDTISSFKNLQSMYNYDTLKISKDDAKFFADLVENKQFAIQQNGENTALIKFADEIGPTYKSQQTSKVLTDLIAKAYNDQKPVRIDFDNNVSVVLKIDTKGKISADFIPGDKAVEMYLKNNIGYLRQRFDDQNIPYNDILYRQSNNGNQNKERQKQQKDKGE